jgi:hypothetical protein
MHIPVRSSKVRQRRKGPTGLDEDVRTIGRTDLCLHEVGERHIILALQLCEERVLRVIPTRVARERVAAKGAVAQKALDEMMCCCQRCGYATMALRILVSAGLSGAIHRLRQTRSQTWGWRCRLTGYCSKQYICTDVQVSRISGVRPVPISSMPLLWYGAGPG